MNFNYGLGMLGVDLDEFEWPWEVKLHQRRFRPAPASFDERLDAYLEEHDRLTEHYDNAAANSAAVMGRLDCPTTPVRKKTIPGDMHGSMQQF